MRKTVRTIVLYNINLIEPKALAPGANAFKYIDGGEWLNKIVFPVTQERFLQDARKVWPGVGENLFSLDPGDTITIDKGHYYYEKGGCPFVKKIVDDRQSRDFSPVTVGNQIVDKNPNQFDETIMTEAITESVQGELLEYINNNKYDLFNEHKRWNVIYQLEFIFPNGTQTWYFDFNEETMTAHKGRNALANFFTYITASGFYSLLQYQKGWDFLYLGGYYRSFNKIYFVSERGLVLPKFISFPDPLLTYYNYGEFESIMRDMEVKKWGKK